ncbi:MAG: GDSL-type esterase/lipase family protein [Chloroflexota bacterium]
MDANTWAIGKPYINYGVAPGQRGMNEMGFRNELFELPKPEGVFRILALGGSTTYGYNVEREAAYPNQMGRILREDYGYENVEVINAGVELYDTLNSLVNFQTRGLEQEPDLVIVYHGINDAVDRRRQAPECFRGINPLRGFGNEGIFSDNNPTLSRSTLVRFVQFNLGLSVNPASLEWRSQSSGLCDILGDPTTNAEVNNADYFRRNIQNIIAVGQMHNVEVMLTTQSLHYDAIEQEAAANDRTWIGVAEAQREHNDIVRGLASQYDVALYDFEAVFDPDPREWFIDHTHLREEGLQQQAEMFAAFIHENGLIPSS